MPRVHIRISAANAPDLTGQVGIRGSSPHGRAGLVTGGRRSRRTMRQVPVNRIHPTPSGHTRGMASGQYESGRVVNGGPADLDAEPSDYAVSHWVRVFRRRRRLFLLTLVVLITAVTAVLMLRSTPVTATATVLVDADAAVPSTTQTVFVLQAQIDVANSRAVRDAVLDQIGTEAGIVVTGNEQKALVTFQASEATPDEAAAVADAYADAFASVLRTQTAQRYEAALAAIDEAIAVTQAQLDRLPPGATSPEATQLASQLDAYLQARAELQVEAALAPLTVARVVAPAEAASQESLSGKLVRSLSIAIVLGLLIALAVVATAEALDRSIRDARWLSAARLRVLATLPRCHQNTPISGQQANPDDRSQGVARAGTHDSDAYLILRNSLMLQGADTMKIVHVVAPTSDDGAGEVAANLAIAFARSGRETALADMDPERSASAACDARVGQVTGSGAAKRPTSRTTPIRALGNLVILRPPPSVGGDLLSRPSGRQFLESLKDRPELVIASTGPMGLDPVAHTVSSEADATVLVLTTFATPNEAARRAIDLIRLGRGDVLGVVLRDGSRLASPAVLDLSRLRAGATRGVRQLRAWVSTTVERLRAKRRISAKTP